ncbi:MAG TPA: carboxypeptidase regulatory-like domain-containing protein, partial [Candidatus Polarisedimenticolaceae bacterium]|nr:carboxypeptidase regulatory-like domain-containing protein [Candidatus Polarisedimenticolaceae bacterium]
MRTSVVVIAVLCFVLCAPPASARTGALTVTVTDPDGRPMPQVTVTLSNADGLIKSTVARTDEAGRVAFPVLAAGDGYRIEVSAPGFAAVAVAQLRVPIGETTSVPVRLAPDIAERVSVTARTDVVDLTETQASTRFTDEFVRDLPVAGRFYQNMLTLAPGVEDSDGDGNPTVHGSRARDFKAVVSGVSNVDPLTGQWMSRINPNSIEEMEIITAGAGVEFGRAQGGYARILQKQGSNSLEGVFDFLYRSSALDQPSDVSNVGDPQYESYQTGFQLSGPIVRDRLWYRLSHEWIRREDPVDIAIGTEVVETDQATHSDQLTWQVSPRNKLSFSYQGDPLEISNFGVSNIVSPESSQRREFGGETYSVRWTAPYSAKVLIESQVAWQELDIGILPTTAGVLNDCVTGLPALQRAECLDTTRSRTSGSASRTLDDRRQRLTVRGDVTTFVGRFLGATHQLKAGVIVENERYFRSLEQRPRTRLFVVPPFTIENGELQQEGTFLAAQIAVPETDDVRATGVSFGLYIEDQLKPAQNLSITLGLRFDREEIDSSGHSPFDPLAEQATYFEQVESGAALPSEALRQTFTAFEATGDLTAQLARLLGLSDNDITQVLSPIAVQSEFWAHTRRLEDLHLVNDNLAPYLGLSWDPWKDGKTKLALVASRHYNNIPLSVPLVELEPVEADLTFRAFPGTRLITRPFGGVNLGLSTQLVDRDLATPYQDELYLSAERQVASETSLRLSYIKRLYRDQLQDRDINRFTGDFGICRHATPTNRSPIRATLETEFPDTFPGDGVIDDCTGRTEPIGDASGGGTNFLQRPDGFDDLYIANPGWVDVLLVGNFNRADYDAVVFEVIRRLYRDWEMQLSYTYAEAVGDGEDFLQQFGNDNALAED